MPDTIFARWLLVALVLGIAVRAWDLGGPPIWEDEAATLNYAGMEFADCVTGETQHPPLFRTLTWGVVRTLGDSESAVRLLPLLFGVATILAGWLLARETRPDAAGACALLLAASPFLAFYSRECRGYALLVLLSVLSTWAFFRIVRRGRGHVFYGALSALLLLTHYFGAFVLVAHEIAYWVHDRRRPGAWIAARLGAALLVAPWAVWLLGHVEMQDRPWIAPPWRTLPLVVVRVYVGYGVAAHRASRLLEPVGDLLRQELPVVLPLLAPLLWLTVRGARRLTGVPRTVVFAVIFVPLLVLLPLSVRYRFLTPRYLTFLAPFVLLLVAVGLASLRGRARIGAGAATAAVLAFALAAWLLAPGRLLGYPLLFGHEQWREAGRYGKTLDPDEVVYRPEYLRKSFVRYYGPDEPREAAGRPRRVLLVLSHLSRMDEERERSKAVPGGREIAERYFPEHSGIRLVLYEAPPR